MDHLWAALRYAELNPVRAGMAPEPEIYRWSSAALHCGRSGCALPLHVDSGCWSETWNAQTWRAFLRSAGTEPDSEALRANTHTGRPLGSEDFVQTLERTLHRILRPRKGGRPRKPEPESAQ